MTDQGARAKRLRETPHGAAPWSYFTIHDLVRVKTNARIPAIPAYFRTASVDPDFEIELVENLPAPRADSVERIVGFTAYDLGAGELLYEAEVPILFLLGSRARWRFTIGGVVNGRTRIVTATPFYRFPPVRFRVTQLLNKLFLLLLTIRLVQRDHAMCHAAAVAKDGMAHLFFGFSGTGKATLAGMLLEHGYEFLSDDFLITDTTGQVYCYPDWHKPRPSQARIPLSEYFGLTSPFDRPTFRIRNRARAGPVYILERGPDRIEELDTDEAIRRILLLNIEELSKFWNSPISPVLNHYAYFYPEFDIESLLVAYREQLERFLGQAGPFLGVRSSSPDFPVLKSSLLKEGGD